mgnify:FL=1
MASLSAASGRSHAGATSSPSFCGKATLRPCGTPSAVARAMLDCGDALQTCMPRQTNHDEAIALYKRLPPHRIEGGSRGSDYGEAFAIVKKVRALRLAHKQLGMFGDELAEIRLEWKRKRNFMKLIDAL